MGNSSGGAALQQQCSGNLEGFSYTERGFRAGRSDIPMWALYHVSIDRETIETSTLPSGFCIGRTWTATWNPFSHGLRIETIQSQTRIIRMQKHSCSLGKALHNLLLPGPNGKLWLYKQAVNLGNAVAQGSFTSGKNEGGSFLTRWFLSKYL